MNNTLNTTKLPGFLTDRGIGFDKMFDLVDEFAGYANTTAYPPYNLIRESEDDYTIEVALAGFNIDDIEITQDGKKLQIQGKKPDFQDQEKTYLHRGISARSFKREFLLAEHVDVQEAEMTDGVLVVKLHREIPDEMKPRQIEIKKSGK